ncbi:MAG: peroxide stress protein YaaA [Gammaproteobacteria bacterium]|nr:peroxide stress protein YaaA [Gammaproteobacteria bacterium]
MLTVISPAKTLDFDTPPQTDKFTQPVHLEQSRQLIKRLRDFSASDLSSLMSVSDNIANLNVDRFKQWKTPFTPDNSRQALFTFKGDVYIGLDAFTMSQRNISFAQNHLRILSGLYGLLRPLDLMQAYRLEMGTRLDTDQGSNLYQFWDSQITTEINRELSTMKSPVLVNLASNEYFKSVKPKAITGDIVTPVFKEYHKGKYQIISFFAKKARGLMARYLIDNEITDIEAIKDFNLEGYAFDESLSQDQDWVFSRRQ